MKNKKNKNQIWIKALLDNFESDYICSAFVKNQLVPKYSKIILLGTQYTYEEIGEVFDITRQRAEQLHKQAVGHLLKFLNQ